MNVKISRRTEIGNLLQETATVINGKYYFLPFWFEKTGDGIFILHHLDQELPSELTKAIEARGEAL